METVKVDVNFGQEMGSYTVDVAYDSNLLNMYPAEGGTANDNGTRIKYISLMKQEELAIEIICL